MTVAELKTSTRALAVTLLLGGCTPDPRNVCLHIDGVATAGHSDRVREQRSSRVHACVTQLAPIRSTHPREYETAARCSMAATTELAVLGCLMPLDALASE